VTRAILAALIVISLAGCETGFRVWEGALYLPSMLIVRPMNRFIAKPCPNAVNMWDGSAGSPCRSALTMREPSVETSWTWRPASALPDRGPAIYMQNCATCHDHASRAPDLRTSEFVSRSTFSDIAFFLYIGRPSKGMPGWGGGRLPMEEIESVAKYIKQ